ncbi:MAG: SPFH domain-containing protein [Anaerolineales bacterium]|nr:SPFH domain-containing protein [Anaerolineales bacterium]MCX7608963.1 SPFH domain-containing protein [Anaerolineales bacterium]MDW8448060.1 SPFH domain-containing protein [Anaerolineales bacterium]
MPRVFDVIEYPNEMENELVHRFPDDTTSGEYRLGSNIIVRSGQAAVFFRDGLALDTFGPGRHVIATANIPLLTEKIQDLLTAGKTIFPAEVYFVSMKEFANRKWGTPNPILVRNPGMGLGVALLQGYGTYGFQVKDPQQLILQIVGKKASFTIDAIEERLRNALLSKLQDTLNEWSAKMAVPELLAKTIELGSYVQALAEEEFNALGLTLKRFIIASLKPSEKSAEELRAMGMLDMATYTQLQAADAMREAAQNPSGGAGLTAGIGAGIGIGNLMGQALQGGIQAGQPQQPVASTPTGSAMPEVMTPSEAATFLRVSEEDVLAAIKDGSLKAKKIGNAWRISKAALEEFLKS